MLFLDKKIEPEKKAENSIYKMIPRMLDNAFKLTIDLLAAPPQHWPNSKKHLVPTRASQNLFELVF